MKIKRKEIKDKYYYRFEALSQSPKFRAKVNKLLSLFKRFDCGIPENGFKSWKEVEKWSEKLEKKRSEVVKSKAYKQGRNKITGDKERFTPKEWIKLNRWERENARPPAWMENVREILEGVGLDRKDETNQKILRNFILFKKFKDPRTILRLKLSRNKKTDDPELWVKVFPYTLKSDICDNWKEIEDVRKCLPGYVGKSKKRKKLSRDLEIYALYKRALRKCNGDEKKAFLLMQKKLEYSDRLLEIEAKYGQKEELSEESLRKIIKRLNKLIGSLDI
jgi:hypothetical protein